jgi:hypothetical protein
MENSLNNRNNFVIISVNSFAYLMLGYFSVLLFTNLLSMLVGVANGFSGTLYYYGFFLTEVAGSHWSKDVIFQVYLLGTGLTFIAGIVFERHYKRKRKYSGKFKMYFFWLYVLSFTWFFGNVIVGGLANYGIGAALRALSIPLVMRVVLSVIAMAALVLVGYLSRLHVLISANTYFHFIRIADFRKFLLYQIFVPAIAANFLIFLLKIPHHDDFNYLDSLVVLSVFLFIAGLFLSHFNLQSINFKHHNRIAETAVLPLVILLIVILLVRVGLSFGLTI